MDKMARRLIKIVESNGWVEVKKRKGSGHLQFEHPTMKGRVTIPHTNIKKNIVKSVLKQAGIEGSISDFRKGTIENKLEKK